MSKRIYEDLYDRTLDELQDIARKECGGDVTSTNELYLRWRIIMHRRGVRGNVRIKDPRKQARVPFYLAEDDVRAMDAIVEASDYTGRQHFLHAALADFLSRHHSKSARALAQRIFTKLPPRKQR